MRRGAGIEEGKSWWDAHAAAPRDGDDQSVGAKEVGPDFALGYQRSIFKDVNAGWVRAGPSG